MDLAIPEVLVVLAVPEIPVVLAVPGVRLGLQEWRDCLQAGFEWAQLSQR